MRLGPITISWTSRLTQRAHEAQALDLRRNRCIAGQSHDIQALRRTVTVLRINIGVLERKQSFKGWDDETTTVVSKELNPEA